MSEELLRAARQEGIEAATGIDLQTDMALLAVQLGVIDRTAYETMRTCHKAYTTAKEEVRAQRVRVLRTAGINRKMEALGRQDGAAARPGPRGDRDLAEHFELLDDCTLNELSAYHQTYLAAYESAHRLGGAPVPA